MHLTDVMRNHFMVWRVHLQGVNILSCIDGTEIAVNEDLYLNLNSILPSQHLGDYVGPKRLKGIM